jgi:hypothetical protein
MLIAMMNHLGQEVAAHSQVHSMHDLQLVVLEFLYTIALHFQIHSSQFLAN